MARYVPKTAITVTEPCDVGWDAMPGDSRERHCVQCNRSVFNSVAMSRQQMNDLLQAGDALPCMRLAQYPGGSLLIADEYIRPKSVSSMIGTALVSILALTSGFANAQKTSSSVPTAQVSGRVVDPWGRPVKDAEVVFSQKLKDRFEEKKILTDSEGRYEASVSSGTWSVSANRGISRSATQGMRLRPAEQRTSRTLTLQPITVTAGVIAMVPPRLPSTEKDPGQK